MKNETSVQTSTFQKVLKKLSKIANVQNCKSYSGQSDEVRMILEQKAALNKASLQRYKI